MSLNVEGTKEGQNTLLALKMEEREAWAKEFMHSLETGKHKGTDSSLEPPEEVHPCWHLDFKPERPVSDLSRNTR